MADELKEAEERDEKARTPEQDPEIWDWARAAGVSREELLKALERTH